MKTRIRATLEQQGWLRRTIEVRLSGQVYRVEYNGRNLGQGRVTVDGRVLARSPGRLAEITTFEFSLAGRPACIEVVLSHWFTIRSLHLFVESELVYCDRQPLACAFGKTSNSGSAHRSKQPGNPPAPACEHCGEQLSKHASIAGSTDAEPIDVLPADEEVAQEFKPTGHAALKVVAGITALIAGIVLPLVLWTVPEFQQMHITTRRGIGTISVGLIVCGLFFIVTVLRSRDIRVRVDGEGLEVSDRAGRARCRWRDVAALRELLITTDVGDRNWFLAWVTGENHILTLECKDGSEVVVKNYVKGFARLIEIAKNQTLNLMLRSALANYDEGRRLAFGPLAIDTNEMRHKDSELHWNEVESYAIEKGWVRVTATRQAAGLV